MGFSVFSVSDAFLILVDGQQLHEGVDRHRFELCLSRHSAMICWQRCSGKRVRRLERNFAPAPECLPRGGGDGRSIFNGYFAGAAAVTKNISIALAMERLSASRYSRL